MARKSSKGRVTINVPKSGKYKISLDLLCGAPFGRATKSKNTLQVSGPGKYEMFLAPTTALAGGDWMEWSQSGESPRKPANKVTDPTDKVVRSLGDLKTRVTQIQNTQPRLKRMGK